MKVNKTLMVEKLVIVAKNILVSWILWTINQISRDKTHWQDVHEPSQTHLTFVIYNS